jgi:hypothetical protein
MLIKTLDFYMGTSPIMGIIFWDLFLLIFYSSYREKLRAAPVVLSM